MKIVSWNCRGGFRNKIERIISLNADIYVIQESENPDNYPKLKNRIIFILVNLINIKDC